MECGEIPSLRYFALRLVRPSVGQDEARVPYFLPPDIHDFTEFQKIFLAGLENVARPHYNRAVPADRRGGEGGSMAVQYPKNPRFDALQMRLPDYRDWREGCAHDPSVLEWDGRFYAYSTDTFGAPSGCQIRVSHDLLHWEYYGSAFDLENSDESYRRGEAKGKFGNLQPAFDWCVTRSRDVGYGACTRPNGSMSLWAPNCVRGTDGKFWLYYCLTGYFGGSRSCVGLAKSDRPDGGFVSERILVQSPSGWRTPNAIDPQVFFAEGRMFLVYGSFGLGLYLLELDPNTGARLDTFSYADFEEGKASTSEYYGTQLASGSLEAGAIRYHEGVRVRENGKWVRKNYYYLLCSYGSLSAAYQIRCGRSERPEGPYLDGNGNPLVCSTDVGTGNKMFGSFRLYGAADFFCPGHADFFRTERGTDLISYHCRTNLFIEKGFSRSNNFHYLYLSQYAFNEAGWPVMNLNRYAGEELQSVTEEDLLADGGRYEAVLFSQSVNTVEGKPVRLAASGKIEGAMSGKWTLHSGKYVRIETEKDTYLGVVMPAWIDGENRPALTISCMGVRSCMALHLNGTERI